jgi:hypothetical protein
MNEATKVRVEAALRWTCPDCGGTLAWGPATAWHPCYGPDHQARFCAGPGCRYAADFWERAGEAPRTAFVEWYIERHGVTGEMAFCIGTRPADRVAPTEA